LSAALAPGAWIIAEQPFKTAFASVEAQAAFGSPGFAAAGVCGLAALCARPTLTNKASIAAPPRILPMEPTFNMNAETHPSARRNLAHDDATVQL
jgi:hypothetical protein